MIALLKKSSAIIKHEATKATFAPFMKVNRSQSFRSTSAILESDEKRRVKVYTKTGDKGFSSLFNGERRPKTDVFFDALGNTDELNASVGVAKEFTLAVDNSLAEKLEEIQAILLDVGSCIATPRNTSNAAQLERTKFDPHHTTDLENWIDEMDKQLPPLTNFILPSGGKSSSFLHVARAVCRRAERSVIALLGHGGTDVKGEQTEEELVDKNVGMYLNRLSDFLFVAARFMAMKEGRQEVIYKKPKTKAQN